MLKDVILVNNDLSLDLKDKEGNVLRSITHFGVHTKKLDLLFFKGRKEVEVAEIDFDKFAEELVSHYGENNFKGYIVEKETKEDLKRNLVDNLEQVKSQIASVTEELNKEKTKLEKELRSILDNEFVGEGTVFAYGSSATYALYSKETKTLNKEKLTEFLALNGKSLAEFEDVKTSMVMNNYKTGSK